MTVTADKAQSAFGELPSGWTRRRLRFDVRLNPKKSSLQMEPDEQVSFVSMDAVGVFGGLNLEDNKELSEVYDGYTYFADGDLCIAKITPCFENGKGALAEGLTNGVGFGTTELHVVRPGQTIEPRFLFYVSIAHDFRMIGESEMYGAGGQKRINEDFIKDWMPPLPPMNAQRRIAEYLDNKTTRIDGLIGKKRELLQRLSEKRQALITSAVTKGLDPNAPTKPSGITWLGDTPLHWSAQKIKFAVSHVVDCMHTTPTYDGEVRYPAVRTADVERGRLLLEQARLVSKEVYDERTQRLVPVAGDILYSREGERFGMAALVPTGVDICLGQRMMMFRAWSDFDPAFMMWCLNSEAIYQQVTLFAGGSTSPHVNIRDIINFTLPKPPVSEQVKIGKYVSGETAKIDRQSELVAISINKLNEYRSSLITAAVTGQIGELNG